MKHLFFLIIILSNLPAIAQVGVGTDAPHPSAILEIKSSNTGFLFPRMSTSNRDNITAPAEGLIIYNTDTKCIEARVDNNWLCINNSSLTTTTTNAIDSPCNSTNPTVINDVFNPSTGKTWMDRNLGANRVALNVTDTQSYGSLYQWGRSADGHQCVNRFSTDGISTSGTYDAATLGHPNNATESGAWDGLFIEPDSPNSDWLGLNPNPLLWSNVNNPCPSGYRLPSESELNSEVESWPAGGAIASVLKLPRAGFRNTDGNVSNVGSSGFLWSSTSRGPDSVYLSFNSEQTFTIARAFGFSVRCIKD
jgi:hypothetical protein